MIKIRDNNPHHVLIYIKSANDIQRVLNIIENSDLSQYKIMRHLIYSSCYNGAIMTRIKMGNKKIITVGAWEQYKYARDSMYHNLEKLTVREYINKYCTVYD